jgi:hypothetical protein
METQPIAEVQYVIDQRKAAKVLRFSGHWFRWWS